VNFLKWDPKKYQQTRTKHNVWYV